MKNIVFILSCVALISCSKDSLTEKTSSPCNPYLFNFTTSNPSFMWNITNGVPEKYWGAARTDVTFQGCANNGFIAIGDSALNTFQRFNQDSFVINTDTFSVSYESYDSILGVNTRRNFFTILSID